MRTTALCLVALLVVPAGVFAAPQAAAPVSDALPAGEAVHRNADGTAAQQEAPPDPETDRIGWENGYWHNESVDVDQSDGLSDAELEAYVARGMARVEYIRGQEFTSSVPVTVRTREEYRNESRSGSVNASQSRWNNQVWEAPLVVSENENVSTELQQFYGEAVAGFYSPREDSIVVVTNSPDRPVVDNATLVHELVHALQDQQYNLSDARYEGATQDAQLGGNGLVEGEANYVEARYTERCGAEWRCVATPSRLNLGGGDVHLGIYLTVFQPYADGPAFVHDLVEARGWEAVDALHESPPTTTEQVIHRVPPGEYEGSTPIPLNDTATGGWELFADQGVDGSDTVGEATMYAGFWYQSREYDAGPVDWRVVGVTSGPYDQLNYTSTPSAGWAGDRVFPYHNPDSAEDAFVWETRWDTERDARQFADAYVAVLADHGAEQVGTNTYVVPDGPFADAFRVVRQGDAVTVVNGPDRGAVDDLRPALASIPDQSRDVDGDGAGDGSDGADDGDDGSDGADDADDGGDTEAGDGDDGVGTLRLVGVLVAAVVVFVLIAVAVTREME